RASAFVDPRAAPRGRPARRTSRARAQSPRRRARAAESRFRAHPFSLRVPRPPKEDRMPGKRPSVKNEKQYEKLKEKGMSKERAAKIANSPGASSRGGKAWG